MPEQIIGSPIQNWMAVNNSGAVPIAAYSGGIVYPLQVNAAGELLTAATATVTTGSKSYIFGKSGAGWIAALVDATGKLETVASVTVDSVFIASGADIGSVYLKDGAYVNVMSSGTTGFPISGVITVDSILGSVAVTTSPLPVSGAYFPGSINAVETTPVAIGRNNPEWEIIYSGAVIGSMIQHIGTGSYISVFTYTGNNLTNIGSYV